MSDALSLDIQLAIENRLAAFDEVAFPISGDQGAARRDVRSRYWVAYEGSTYEQPFDPLASSFTQDRTLRFSHYVEVLDLRRDYQRALDLHEQIMAVMNGFRPDGIPQLKSPLLLEQDGILNQSGVNDEPRYRYRAQYRIVALAAFNRDGETFQLQGVRTGLWRSPIESVGDKTVSTLDKTLAFDTEGQA